MQWIITMNPFNKLIENIFSNEAFLEDVIINSENLKCICSSIDDQNVSFSDAGLIDNVSFALDVKLPVRKPIKEGDKVKFRNVTYKVATVETDSANTSLKITLQSVTKG